LKKLLVVGVIVLFLGLACAPSINANVSKDSELVEITTEICGLGGFWEHPIFYILDFIAGFRILRGLSLVIFTSNFPPYNEELKVNHPILFIRGVWLAGTGFGITMLLQSIIHLCRWI